MVSGVSPLVGYSSQPGGYSQCQLSSQWASTTVTWTLITVTFGGHSAKYPPPWQVL